MSVLKQLVPFVRLCQFFGLIPFTTVMDPETKEFLRFGFKLKSAPALWYFFLLSVQMLVIPLPVSTMPDLMNSDLFRELNLSPAAIALLVVDQLSLMVLFVTKRVTVLRFKHLRRAVALVKEVEQYLSDLPTCRNRVVRRTIIGFIVSAIMVFLFIYLSIPLVEIFLPGVEAPSRKAVSGTLLILVILQTYLMTMVSCSFLMLHLSYYVIAHYFRLLKVTLAKDLPFKLIGIDNESDMVRMKKSKVIFNNLCLATIELNHVFSFPALFMITSKLFSILYGLFTFIYGLIKPTIFMEKAFFLVPFTTLMHSVMVYVYLTSADNLVNQVRQLREKVISMSNARMQSSVDYRIEVMSFMTMMDEDRVRLTGYRLFKVGVQIIPPFVASLVTYLIIMVQTQINTISSTNHY